MVKLSSALFQAAVYLESAYPNGSQERMIADLCAQASAAMESPEPEQGQGAEPSNGDSTEQTVVATDRAE